MRRAILISLGGLTIAGCATDQRLTGLSHDATAGASLVPMQVVSRCGRDGRASYRPYVEIDGRLYAPADSAALPALDAASVMEIRVVKGESAVKQYGAVAGAVGVVIVTTRHAAAGRA